MMEKQTDNGRSLRLPDFKAGVQRLRVSRTNSMFGLPEIIAVAGSALILVMVLLSYVYFLVPARSRLEAVQLERTRLQNLTRDSEQNVLQGLGTESIVEKISASLDDFESRGLVNASQGRMGLYEELNQLIRKNGLRNTSGPSYTPLEPVGSKKSATSKSSNSKWQSVYPGITVSLTVEGSYQNLRRFIRNVESSNQFIIINGMELEKATEMNIPVTAAEGSPDAGSRGSLVSLRLDLATYFQRSSDSESTAPVR